MSSFLPAGGQRHRDGSLTIFDQLEEAGFEEVEEGPFDLRAAVAAFLRKEVLAKLTQPVRQRTQIEAIVHGLI